MRKLTEEEYAELIADAKVLARDTFGDKVLLTPDDIIIKLFRSKRRLSSARLFPYAERFRRNSERLRALGIAAIEVREVYDCPAIRRHVLTYRRLPGTPVREAVADPASRELLLAALAEFIAELHGKGIYFRSLHLGNVLVLPSETFALIDIADMQIASRGLGIRKRVRNFRHLLKYDSDRSSLEDFGLARFQELYLDAAGIRGQARERYLRLINQSSSDRQAVGI